VERDAQELAEVRIYVASSFENKEEVRDLYTCLEILGHTITCDWTDHEEPYNYQQLQQWALDDAEGVEHCDALVALIAPGRTQQGTWCEIGMALAWGKPVTMIGIEPTLGKPIFAHLPGIAFYPDLKTFIRVLTARGGRE
jgi:nucleoside 2-deoxyribosyltransferase